MWTIRSLKDLRNFTEGNGNGVVSVYLDDGLNPQITRTIYEAKSAFDRIVEWKWHILLPHRSGGVTVEFEADPRGYSFEVARQIAEVLNLAPDSLPALVFMDPLNQKAVQVLSLSGMSADTLIHRVREIAAITTRDRELGPEGMLGFRDEVLAEIKAFELNGPIVSAARQVLPASLRWLFGRL